MQANGSRRHREQVGDILRNRFPMLNTVGKNAKSECLHTGDRLSRSGPIRHHAWQFRNLGQPTAVILLLNFDRESHESPSVPRIFLFTPSLSI